MTEKNNMQEAEGDNTMLTNKDILKIALQQSAYDIPWMTYNSVSEGKDHVVSC